MCILHKFGGAFTRKPFELKDQLSGKAADLLKRAWDDIDPSRLVDYHTHVAGIGTDDTNTFVNARMLPWAHPFHRVKFAIYLTALGVKSEKHTDSKLAARIVDLVQHTPFHGKHRLLAFDKHYNPDGSVNLAKTEFYVPNEYVFDLTNRFSDLFLPTMSVHPFRADALAEMEKWASRGCRILKWLPNAMGINPSDPRCDRFYQRMKELNIVLLSHGGEEKAVEADEDQKLGNPLLLRRPLDLGVKVIVAHCAGLGYNEDLDSPARERRTNFEFFLRLMDEKKYEGLVFGEISAITQFNRIGTPLTTMLQREDLHPRLINGSDYPLPAINILVRTGPLVKAGYITGEERKLLNEIYHFNPLVYDFALKRCVRLPDTGRQFPASVFMLNPLLGV